MKLERRSAAAVALLVFAWLAATAWIRPLAMPDEGRYVGVAWEMLRSGDWAVPRLDGLPFFHKPPLFYWISAAAMQLTGDTAWAGRMPSVLGGVLAAAALHAFTRRWSGERHALWATAVLATQPFFYAGAQYANLDMLVAGCIAATVLLGADAVLRADAGLPNRTSLWGAYAMAALGVLAKGLIGGVLPAAVFIVWLVAARRPRLILSLLSLPGLLIFLALALPWFFAMQARYPGFYDYFIVYHHFQRYALPNFNNQQPFWFYLPVILLLCLPWSPALLGARREPSQGRGPSVGLLMACWAAVIVLFFSLPKSKLVGYVLPALPPLAWWMARPLLADGRWARAARWLAGLAALACVVGIVAVARLDTRSARPLAQALAERQRGDEPVVAVARYPYDLPFYARLTQPVLVLDDWRRPDIVRHDDWRKELYDAGLFEPATTRGVLVDRDALLTRLCAQPRAWIIGSRIDMIADPWFQAGTQVAATRELVLWSLPRSALNCPGTPSAGSARK